MSSTIKVMSPKVYDPFSRWNGFSCNLCARKNTFVLWEVLSIKADHDLALLTDVAVLWSFGAKISGCFLLPPLSIPTTPNWHIGIDYSEAEIPPTVRWDHWTIINFKPFSLPYWSPTEFFISSKAIWSSFCKNWGKSGFCYKTIAQKVERNSGAKIEANQLTYWTKTFIKS